LTPTQGTPIINTTGNNGENISIASGAGSVIIQLGGAVKLKVLESPVVRQCGRTLSMRDDNGRA